MQLQIASTRERIERINERIERLQSSIESCGASERRLRRLERQNQKLINQQNKLDELTGLQDKAEAQEEAGILPDSFAFSVTPVGDVLTRVDVQIYDSPFDETFTGGEPLTLRATASGKRTPSGISSATSTVAFANGEYWDGLARQTLFYGSSTWNSWADYPELVVSVLNADGDLLATQSFDPTQVFA